MKKIIVLFAACLLLINFSQAQTRGFGTELRFYFDWQEAESWTIQGEVKGMADVQGQIQYIKEQINIETGQTNYYCDYHFRNCSVDVVLFIKYKDGTSVTYNLYKYAFDANLLRMVQIYTTDTGGGGGIEDPIDTNPTFPGEIK